MQRPCAITLLCFALCGGPVRAQYVADNRVIPAPIEDTSNETHCSLPVNASATHPWQKEEDRVFGHIRNSRLTRMKHISAGIISLFQDSILTDDALHPIWHGEYFPAASDGPQVRFGVNCVFHNGQDPTASRSDLTVFANDISPLLGRYTVNGHAFITLKAMTGNANQPYFEFDLPAANGADGADRVAEMTATETVHVKAWLVTADSTQLPFIPVTRREYLEEARQELEGRKAVIIAATKENIVIRPAVEQEAERQQALQQLRDTYTGADLQTRTRIYLSNYRKDEDYMTQTIAARTAGLDHTIGLIDSLLRNSTSQQLSLPANVSADAVDFQGFEDGRANSSVLIRLRPSFYSGADPGDQPLKSVLICWRYDPSDPASAGIDRQLANNGVWTRFHSAFIDIRE